MEATATPTAPAKAPDTTKQKAELARLDKRVSESGHDSKMVKRARKLAAELGVDVPKWAKAGTSSTAKTPDKPKRADDPDLQLAHEMTAFVRGGTVVDNKVVVPDDALPFGAPYTATQVKLIRDHFGQKDILKTLGGISEQRLADYAKGNKPDLDADVKRAIKETVKAFDPKAKIWARKLAGAAVILHRHRKQAKRTRQSSSRRRTPTAKKS